MISNLRVTWWLFLSSPTYTVKFGKREFSNSIISGEESGYVKITDLD